VTLGGAGFGADYYFCGADFGERTYYFGDFISSSSSSSSLQQLILLGVFLKLIFTGSIFFDFLFRNSLYY
jgi:hypothetical protein